jgi:hypothetical protein
VREFHGIGANQLVELEPPCAGPAEQMLVRQVVQDGARRSGRRTEQSGRGGGVELVVQVEPEQPERAREFRRERLVRPIEHGPQVAALVTDRQRFQPSRQIAELVHQ